MSNLSKLKIGEEQKGFYRESANARFMRFEKLGKYGYDVYHLCYVDSNGNWYIAHREEFKEDKDGDRILGYNYKDNKLGNGKDAKAYIEKERIRLLSNGYKFIGYYLRDIRGCAMRVESFDSKSPVQIFNGVRKIVFTEILKRLPWHGDFEVNWNKISDSVNDDIMHLIIAEHTDYLHDSFRRRFHDDKVEDSFYYKSHVRDIARDQSGMALDWLVDNGYLTYRKQNTTCRIGRGFISGWYNMYKVTDKGWSVSHLYLNESKEDMNGY